MRGATTGEGGLGRKSSYRRLTLHTAEALRGRKKTTPDYVTNCILILSLSLSLLNPTSAHSLCPRFIPLPRLSRARRVTPASRTFVAACPARGRVRVNSREFAVEYVRTRMCLSLSLCVCARARVRERNGKKRRDGLL